jgi:hypothetical protein
MWFDTTACQAITEKAATEMISRLTTTEDHQLRGLDGGFRLSAYQSKTER